MAMSEPVLSPRDHALVTEAIRTAEKATSGEIYCVLARSSDDYFYPASFMLAAFILLLDPLVALALHHWWFSVGLVYFTIAQLAAFALAVLTIAAFPAMRVALVPKRLRYRRAHGNARRQFLAHNIHVTERRTGVLIFVSLAERYVEVVADNDIDAKVAQNVWNDAVAALLTHARERKLAEGFVQTVSMVGAVLAEHFPAGNGNPNEIPDRITEI